MIYFYMGRGTRPSVPPEVWIDLPMLGKLNTKFTLKKERLRRQQQRTPIYSESALNGSLLARDLALSWCDAPKTPAPLISMMPPPPPAPTLFTYFHKIPFPF